MSYSNTQKLTDQTMLVPLTITSEHYRLDGVCCLFIRPGILRLQFVFVISLSFFFNLIDQLKLLHCLRERKRIVLPLFLTDEVDERLVDCSQLHGEHGSIWRWGAEIPKTFWLAYKHTYLIATHHRGFSGGMKFNRNRTTTTSVKIPTPVVI